MKKFIGVLFLLFILLGLSYSAGFAQEDTGTGSDGRDAAFEQAIYDRLEAIDPDAAPIFKAATEAMDAGDYESARIGYEDVLRLAPDFPDALRRLSYIFAAQNKVEMAETLARKALSISPTNENKFGLATVLTYVNTPAANQEAFNLAKEVIAAEPDDPDNLMVYMIAAAQIEDVETLRQVCDKLLAINPENGTVRYYSGMAYAVDGKWETAEKELLLAEQNGIPAEAVKSVLDAGVSTQARIQRATRLGLYGLTGWVALLGVLFLAGMLLSWITSRSVNRKKGLINAEISFGERLARLIYRVVIAVSSVYFYVSIPILLVIVVALVAGILYGFLAIGQIPVKVAIFVLIFGLYTLFAVVSSVFIRRKQVDPGKPLERGNGFYLWQMLTDTARQLGTRPVDKIFIVPGMDIAVYERGSWWSRVRGKGERCLILGLAALPGMTQGQFRAIIAHEYGHFVHADTAGGDLALTVNTNLQAMAKNLFNYGTAAWYNPVWLFLQGYYRIFLRITQGASRLQEILADRYAATRYGSENLIKGLEHLIWQNLLFDEQFKREFVAAKSELRPIKNLYTLPAVESTADLQTAYQKRLHERTSQYSSHPSYEDRLAFINRVQSLAPVMDDPRPVWDLLDASCVLQDEMTREIEKNIRAKGDYWVSNEKAPAPAG